LDPHPEDFSSPGCPSINICKNLDPDPSTNKQKIKKIIDFFCFADFFMNLSLKNYVNVFSKSKNPKYLPWLLGSHLRKELNSDTEPDPNLYL